MAPNVGQLADTVQRYTRKADEATRARDAKTMRAAVRKVADAVLAASEAGLTDQLIAELRGRGFGCDA